MQNVDMGGIPGSIPYAHMGVPNEYAQFALFGLTGTTRPEP